MKRLGILLSGRGSNFEAIADSVARGEIAASIAVVISNRAEARGVRQNSLGRCGFSVGVRRIRLCPFANCSAGRCSPPAPPRLRATESKCAHRARRLAQTERNWC